jgi:hypothetical protein
MRKKTTPFCPGFNNSDYLYYPGGSGFMAVADKGSFFSIEER